MIKRCPEATRWQGVNISSHENHNLIIYHVISNIPVHEISVRTLLSFMDILRGWYSKALQQNWNRERKTGK